MACVEQHAGYARFCRAAWDHSLHATVINVADWLLTAPLSVHQVMINGHALCSPISFARGCDPCRPGTAVQWSARSEVRTNDLDGLVRGAVTAGVRVQAWSFLFHSW